MANFLVYHRQVSNAAKLLRPYANKIYRQEDLFFYYLSLIIYSNSEINRDSFDQKMEQALEMNQNRFCKLFGHPALTFQLMRKLKLKGLYCNNCQEKENTPDIKSIIGDDDTLPKSITLPTYTP